MGLSPVLVLMAVLVGGKLWGPIGALLGIPLIGLMIELLKDFLRRRKEENYE
jgi:predicted PurR-regulated permease PerM